jgi:activating signal cointegrator 1
MKAITLTNPWATLVAIGEKRIETRSWSTPYRGPIAIHAAKDFPAECRALTRDEPFLSALYVRHGRLTNNLWTLGGVVATARLTDVQYIASLNDVRYLLDRYGAQDEYAFGNFQPGRYAWLLDHVEPLPKPIHAKGMLGVWEWEHEMARPAC